MTLTDILRELGIDFREHGQHHHTSRSRVQVDCPWCSPRSGRFRMGLKLNGAASCWSCGFHSLSASLAELSGKRQGFIIGLLKESEPDRHEIQIERRGKLVLPPGIGPLLPVHLNYLKGRGLDPDKIQKLWNVQGIGQGGRFSWRLFIPIDLDGETVSWTTRSVVDGSGAKYGTARPEQEAVGSKTILYSESYCRHSVVVHEGPLDVWATGPGAVATLGTIVTRAQVLRIAKYPRRVICLDSEPDAQRRALRLCNDLAAFPGETINLMLESGKDPAEADPKEIKKLRRRFLK